jgi:RNA polymerase-binding transcription factor DksA
MQGREKSGVECEMCGIDVHPKRLQLINKAICVGCMEELEAEGRGTQKHQMTFQVHTHGDEIESIETTIVRKE